MDAARLLYGEIELEANGALSMSANLDESFDSLKETIDDMSYSLLESEDWFNSTSESMGSAGESSNVLGNNFENLEKSLSGLGDGFEAVQKSFVGLNVFMFFAKILIQLITSSQSFQKVIAALQKAFEPLLEVVGQFAEFIGGIVADVLLFVIGLFSDFIKFLTKTEQGLALLKIAAIFTGIAIGISLLPALSSLAAAAWGALVALTALLIPLLPFIVIGALVAAALTTVFVILEDLYYFAMGGKESAAGGIFESMGLNKKEIESIRLSIKSFIETTQKLWKSFTGAITPLAPLFKSIFGFILDVAKNFFLTFFTLGYNLVKVFKVVWDLLSSGFSNLWESIKSIFSNIMEFINPLKDALGGVMDLFSSNKSVDVNVNKTEGMEIAGARAEGGNVEAGKSYLINEKGTEIFTPGTDGYVTPNDQINSSKSSGKSALSSIIGTVNINLTSVETMAEDITSKIKEIIRQAAIEAGQELGLQI